MNKSTYNLFLSYGGAYIIFIFIIIYIINNYILYNIIYNIIYYNIYYNTKHKYIIYKYKKQAHKRAGIASKGIFTPELSV